MVGIRERVNTVASSHSHRAARRVRKILQAGGVEQAADLVELYGDVGLPAIGTCIHQVPMELDTVLQY